MIKKIEGIVVSTVDYKESSKIINILTHDEGLIGVFAKNCKSIKSNISPASNALCYGIFYLNYYNNKMPNVIEIDIIDSFKEIKKDIIKLNYSVFLLELTSQVYKHEKSKQVYDLLISGLKKINEGFDAEVITSIIELKSLEYLGIKPEINCCVNCQSADNIVTISSYKGGFLCKNCANGEFIFHLKTLKLIRMFYYVDISKITKLEISDVIKKEITMFIDEYYDRYAGLYLKSKDFLQEFSKENM